MMFFGQAEDASVYKLRAVVVHRGAHYMCLGRRGRSWFTFDDETVLRIRNIEFELKNMHPASLRVPHNAYLLFYVRCQ